MRVIWMCGDNFSAGCKRSRKEHLTDPGDIHVCI